MPSSSGGPKGTSGLGFPIWQVRNSPANGRPLCDLWDARRTSAKQTTQTIPVVIVSRRDPVATGIVASLARPGGNITGSTSVTRDLNAKRLDLLKEAAPRVTRVAGPVKPGIQHRVPDLHDELQPIVITARALHIELQPFEARRPNAARRCLCRDGKARGTLTDHGYQDAMLNANPGLIAELAAAQRLLPLVGFEEFAEGGGLIGYGADFRRDVSPCGLFVDKILKGAKPSEIPSSNRPSSS